MTAALPPRNMLKLSVEEKQKFVNSFDLVLSDCDGVVWTLTGGLPGAKEGIEALQKKLNKQMIFVSNNSASGKVQYEKKFAALGVPFDYESQLIHPAINFATYLNKIAYDKSRPVFLVGSAVHRTILEANGYSCVSAPNLYEDGDVGALYRSIFGPLRDVDVGAVCFDADLNFNMGKFFAAEYLLNKNPDCLFLSGGEDPEYFIYDYSFVGWGHWIRMLQGRVQQKAVGLGKPGSELGQLVMKTLAISDSSRVLFIGDTLEQDIEFAKSNGFQTLLVLSGMTSQEMLDKSDVHIPDFVTNSINDFVQLYRDVTQD